MRHKYFDRRINDSATQWQSGFLGYTGTVSPSGTAKKHSTSGSVNKNMQAVKFVRSRHAKEVHGAPLDAHGHRARGVEGVLRGSLVIHRYLVLHPRRRSVQPVDLLR